MLSKRLARSGEDLNTIIVKLTSRCLISISAGISSAKQSSDKGTGLSGADQELPVLIPDPSFQRVPDPYVDTDQIQFFIIFCSS